METEFPPLLPDPHNKIIQLYGTYNSNNGLARLLTMILDKDGKVRVCVSRGKLSETSAYEGRVAGTSESGKTDLLALTGALVDWRT